MRFELAGILEGNAGGVEIPDPSQLDGRLTVKAGAEQGLPHGVPDADGALVRGALAGDDGVRGAFGDRDRRERCARAVGREERRDLGTILDVRAGRGRGHVVPRRRTL